MVFSNALTSCFSKEVWDSDVFKRESMEQNTRADGFQLTHRSTGPAASGLEHGRMAISTSGGQAAKMEHSF